MADGRRDTGLQLQGKESPENRTLGLEHLSLMSPDCLVQQVYSLNFLFFETGFPVVRADLKLTM